MTQEILIEKDGFVLTMQMNRAEKQNAISQNMYKVMGETLNAADKDPGVRVVVLRGTDTLFSSGNDIKDFQERAAKGGGPSTTGIFFEGILNFRKPLIAAVQGYAIGIGTTMLLHFDMVYAGKSAVFQLSFVNLGLCPEFGSSYVLPMLAGYQKASELFFLGDKFSPEEAKEVGIVNKVFDDEVLMKEVAKIAGSLATKSPASLMATKKLVKDHWAEKIKSAIRADGEIFGKLMKGPEAQEAFQAFYEKRTPDFEQFQK